MSVKIELVNVGDEWAIKQTTKLFMVGTFIKFADLENVGYFWTVDNPHYYKNFWSKDEQLVRHLYLKLKTTHEES